jgi:peptidoglycan/LPS O-acetylase OafA/YrhL
MAAVVHAARPPALPALTGIRAPLAVAIMLFHFTPAGLRWNAHSWLSLYPIVDNGYVFVSFFFLLSGFILFYNYADRTTPLGTADFLVARFLRLYPIYLFTLAVSIPFLIGEWHVRAHTDFFEGAILTPLLLQGLLPRIATFWNTVAWALSCEAIFYLAFPWLLRLRWPRTTGKLLAMFTALWIVGLVPYIAYQLANPDHLAHTADRYSAGFWIAALKYTPLPFFCTFAAGLALAALHKAAALTTRGRTIVGFCGFAAAWFAFYHLAAQTPYILIVGGLFTPIFAAMILGAAGPGPIAAVFSWKPVVAIGAASYCLYILHFNVIILIELHRIPQRLGLARFDPWITYVFVMLLALAARAWIEHPAQTTIGLWWKGRAHQVQTHSLKERA